MHYATQLPQAPAIFANPKANPSSKFMTTHPILSYPINPGLKEFQFFEYDGKTYYVINNKTKNMAHIFPRFMDTKIG